MIDELPCSKSNVVLVCAGNVFWWEIRDTVEDAEATGGVIDGGTWEHRKRAKEMLKTAEDAFSLTKQAKGAHHMGQYLPKEVGVYCCVCCCRTVLFCFPFVLPEPTFC